MDAAAPRYADWKAPPEDEAHLIWPEAGQILRDTIRNQHSLSRETSARLQNVPLAEVRRRLRQQLGHPDDATPLVVTGHQAELYHPGVWAKDVLIDTLAARLGGRGCHVAVDTDEPRRLLLRWPGGSEPLLDHPAAASWTGALDAPTPGEIARLERAVTQASTSWDFEPVVGVFLQAMKMPPPGIEPGLALALTGGLAALDRELGLGHHARVFSPVCSSEPYLLFVHHVFARADAFARDYNAALDAYRSEHRIRAAGRPMPNLNVSQETCEAPFWLDNLSSGSRSRASVVRVNDRWALRSPASLDDTFVFDPAADGWESASKLLRWLGHNGLRLSPRALTLTMLLRLLAADQFVHGIGGARYDHVTDRLIAKHFGVDPPRFAVTTATLYFPGAAARSRACVRCVMQEGHRLRHSVLGDEKRRLVDAIAAAPRGSAERSSLFSQMHGKLAAAAHHPEIVRWQRRRDEAEAREREDRTVFDRELFYAMQPASRLLALVERYRAEVADV